MIFRHDDFTVGERIRDADLLATEVLGGVKHWDTKARVCARIFSLAIKSIDSSVQDSPLQEIVGTMCLAQGVIQRLVEWLFF